MLHLGKCLRILHYQPQALVIKLVGGRPCCSLAKRGSHGHNVIFFGNVLVNSVVRKAREREFPARKENFDLSALESVRMRSKIPPACS